MPIKKAGTGKRWVEMEFVTAFRLDFGPRA